VTRDIVRKIKGDAALEEVFGMPLMCKRCFAATFFRSA